MDAPDEWISTETRYTNSVNKSPPPQGEKTPPALRRHQPAIHIQISEIKIKIT